MIHILEAELRVNAGKDPVDDSIEDEAGKGITLFHSLLAGDRRALLTATLKAVAPCLYKLCIYLSRGSGTPSLLQAISRLS